MISIIFAVNVLLSWSALPSSVADQYNIYAATTSGGYTSTILDTTTDSSVVLNVSPDTPIYFVVTALKGGFEGPASNEVSVLFPPPVQSLTVAPAP